MKRLIYLMHVPWGWIKQRPHFLAEALSEDFDVRVFIRQYFEKAELLGNNAPPVVPVNVIPMLRLTSYSDIVNRLNNRIIGWRLREEVCASDLVWVTRPDMFDLVAHGIPDRVRVVYDCMDDHLAFPAVRCDSHLSRRLQDAEMRLMDRCDLVFASSEHLRGLLCTRYGADARVAVVNNGIHLEDESLLAPPPPGLARSLSEARYAVTYIGTVASWLDLPLLLETVERFKEITVFLVGPVEVQLPVHERIISYGPVEHRFIWSIMARSHCLIMPFLVNDLVRGVNPVKLYEYIFSGRPAVAVGYPETERFDEYVHLYTRREEFLELMSGVAAGTCFAKQSGEDCRAYAAQQSWQKRAGQIAALIGHADES